MRFSDIIPLYESEKSVSLHCAGTSGLCNIAYLTPVISLFMTHFILGEAITIWSAGGLALILLGIAIQIWLNER